MVNTGAGRRPGKSGAREAILVASREAFAAHGLKGATLRAIGLAADVDPALILHYFGSKRGLFMESSALPIDAARVVARLVAGPRETAGRRLADVFLAVWESEATSAPFISLLRSAVSDEEASALFRRRISTELMAPLVAAMDVDAPELRASLLAAQMVGMAIARYVFRIEPLASLAADDVARSLAPALQGYLTGPLSLSKGAPSDG